MRLSTVRPSAHIRGFSLVELLVAMLIGLIGTIVIFQVYAVSEGYKRTTTGAGDAQQNGVLALFAIERDARMAGFGFNYPPLLGCNVRAHDEGPPARDFNFPLVGVVMTDGAGGAPDTITFTYGNSNQLVTSAKLLQPSVSAATTYQVDNRYGFAANDLLIAGEVGKDCSLTMATSIPVVPSDTINRAGGRYNKPGGLGVDYSAWNASTQAGARLFDIGALPTIVRYSVQNSQLMLQDLMTGAAASSIADGIVQLQAQYGWDQNGDGVVADTEWTIGPPLTATDWSRVLALRVAVVARSSQPERPDPATGVCNTTTAAPTWANGIVISLAADPSWQCYRYRVFETVVPIRNSIWFAL
jgi:type IV pilus assembly protein PilW